MSRSENLAYLGPAGSFTHQAALNLLPGDAQLLDCSDLEQVFEALFSGRARYAVAALNSAAGPIARTHEVIAAGQVKDLARTQIAVSFDLYRQGDDDSDLEGVFGHEKALAQIKDWIDRTGVSALSMPSNTAGLEAIAQRRAGWGAVGPPGLAKQFGLEVVAHALESPAQNHTEFVLLSLPT